MICEVYSSRLRWITMPVGPWLGCNLARRGVGAAWRRKQKVRCHPDSPHPQVLKIKELKPFFEGVDMHKAGAGWPGDLWRLAVCEFVSLTITHCIDTSACTVGNASG